MTWKSQSGDSAAIGTSVDQDIASNVIMTIISAEQCYIWDGQVQMYFSTLENQVQWGSTGQSISTVQCITVRGDKSGGEPSTLQYNTIAPNSRTVQNSTAQVQHSAISYASVQCATVQCTTVQGDKSGGDQRDVVASGALCANMVITTKSTDTERKYKTSELFDTITCCDFKYKP